MVESHGEISLVSILDLSSRVEGIVYFGRKGWRTRKCIELGGFHIVLGNETGSTGRNLLALSRARDQQEVDITRKLYGIP